MAQSTSKSPLTKASPFARARKSWRTVLIGAAVPLAVLATAPAAGAEQLPVEPPDVQALIDLQVCLADIQAALNIDVPDAPAEQLPVPIPDPGLPGDLPGAPDVAAMNDTCQLILAIVLDGAPDVPVDPPVDPPVAPPIDLPGPVPATE